MMMPYTIIIKVKIEISLFLNENNFMTLLKTDPILLSLILILSKSRLPNQVIETQRMEKSIYSYPNNNLMTSPFFDS